MTTLALSEYLVISLWLATISQYILHKAICLFKKYTKSILETGDETDCVGAGSGKLTIYKFA